MFVRNFLIQLLDWNGFGGAFRLIAFSIAWESMLADGIFAVLLRNLHILTIV